MKSEYKKELRRIEKELSILKYSSDLLYFDKVTSMPIKSDTYRDEQLGYFHSKIHSMLTSSDLKRLISKLSKENLRGDEKILLQKYQKLIRKNSKIPVAFVAQYENLKGRTHSAWLLAREKNDFSIFEKEFSKLLKLSKDRAEMIKEKSHANLYEALLDEYEEGAKYLEIKELFSRLKPQLVNLFKKIRRVRSDSINLRISESEQVLLCERLFEILIPDRNRFSFAKTTHPFMIRLGFDDVRVTSGFRESSPFFSFTSSAHECGHALHELGFPEKYRDSILLDTPSLGIHESQSRFWEILICQSLEFWKGFTPELHRLAPETRKFSAEDIYQFINNVRGSIIRIEGDEVTYILHIIIRFEIESALINGEISVSELPLIWNKKYKEIFGKSPKNLREGVLQDVHWADGLFGYFPTYALGSIYSVMIFKALSLEIPEISKDIQKLEMGRIRDWLDFKIHSNTNRKKAGELIEQVCHMKLNEKVYIDYLNEKYSKIYNLS